ncbi:MAG: hypothetical protein OSB69_17400, partial [Alphaproteobacteria bacterium]|nr:hypothetical protein [Alphaproteobacteria bacterium]
TMVGLKGAREVVALARAKAEAEYVSSLPMKVNQAAVINTSPQRHAGHCQASVPDQTQTNSGWVCEVTD